MFVTNYAHPKVWVANHVSRATAATPQDIETVFALMEARFQHCAHRAVYTDCFTAPAFTARLALDDFQEQTPVIQMLLRGDPAKPLPPGASLRPVTTEAGWDSLKTLARIDFREGLRTGRKDLSDAVVDGLLSGYRAKSQIAQFFIVETAGLPCAYGSAVRCPNRMGMLEDFFTLPEYRGRGIASGIITHGVRYLREHGSTGVFIGALANERAKYLYARLGFVPLMITRDWIRSRLGS